MVRSWRAHADALTRDAKNCLAAAPSFAPLCRGQFSQFRPIARGAQRDRDVFRMWWMPLHDTVCVKRLGLEAIRAASGRADDSENALVEIGVYRHLADQPDCPVYLLRMLAVFQDCRDVWLVTEFGNGGDLFHTVKRRGVLAEGEARRYTWEVLQAISYLHAHDIAHRDVSAENVVLKDGSARLMDFGAVVPTTGVGTLVEVHWLPEVTSSIIGAMWPQHWACGAETCCGRAATGAHESAECTAGRSQRAAPG